MDRQVHLPYFRGTTLRLSASNDARSFTPISHYAAPTDERAIVREAKERVLAAGGDPSNRKWLLAEMPMIFGKYRGKTFSWLLENDVGWAVMIVTSHKVCDLKNRQVVRYKVMYVG